METNLPTQKLKQTILFVLLLLLSSIINGFAQDTFDGDYCPGPGVSGDEYATGIVFSQQLNPNPSSTCQIGTIRAKVDTQAQVLRLGMNIGNGGAALFRLYLDTDNNPLTGLTSDSFGGALSVAGAEYILEINSNANTFNLYSGNESTLTPLVVNNGLAAQSGSATGCNGSGSFLEFNIPFGSIGFNICDANTPGIINITKLASVSGNSANSSRCIDTPLTFGIPLKGDVSPDATICSGSDSPLLTVTGVTGSSSIVKWQSSVSPFTTWTDIVNTTTTHTATNLTQTTKFRALFINSGLCSGSTIATSEATITVSPAPNAPTSGGDQIVCQTSPIQTLTATATGGSITWYNQGSGGSIVTNPILNAVGTVTYYAQASNGTCSSLTRTPVTLTINPTPNVAIYASTNVSCFGGNNGQATASATGGTAGYSYSWNTSPVQNTATATGLTAGTYTVTVTDAKG
ncbi:SprB repeat-containing protein, partial [Flavobacterium sp. FZUC8N2.13]